MVRPVEHPFVDIHGLRSIPKTGLIFHPDKAHIKEWRAISPKDTVTIRPGKNFTVTSQAEAGVVKLEESVVQSAKGEWTMYYDAKLQAWFNFVASRV